MTYVQSATQSWCQTPTSESKLCYDLRSDCLGVKPLCQSQSYVTTDGESASLSWCQAPSGAQDQIFLTVRQLRV
jgi:hypothetical protein